MLLNRILNKIDKIPLNRCYSSSSVIDKARNRIQNLGDGKIDLKYETDTGIATVTINNVEKKNAISGNMMIQLENIVDELEHWKQGKAVILQAAGDSFCSGGDLETVKVINNPQDGFLMSSFMHHVLTKLYYLPFITLSLVQGRALGGGAELTTATDYRIFTDKTKIGFVQAKMGVITGWGGGTRLVKLIGAKNTLELLCTCKILDANESLKIGLADEVIDHETRDSDVRKWLQSRICHDYSVIQAIKKTVVNARDNSVDVSLLNERECFSPLWGGPVNVDALNKNIKHK